MTETQLMLNIRDALLATGKVMLWRNNVGSARVKSTDNSKPRWLTYGLGTGSPDLVGMLKGSGRFAAWEVKMPGEEPTTEQLCWHKAARDAGALVIVSHSVDEALSGLPPI
jgi:hypothetical protein